MRRQILLTISIFCTVTLSLSPPGSRDYRVDYNSHVLKERAPDTDTKSSEELWVFTVNPGHGKDPAFTDIDKYVVSKLGSDATSLKDNKVLDVDGSVLWFYAEANAEEAKEIKAKWGQTARLQILSVEPLKKFDLPVDTGLIQTDEQVTEEKIKPSRIKRALEARQARPELCALSQDPRSPTMGDPYVWPCDYTTDESQGLGVTVYVVGFGANLDHDEFKHIKRKSVQWIFSDLKNNHKREDWPDPERISFGLGTAVLSKLCGLQYGVSKKITPVIVKVTDGDGNLNFVRMIQGLMNLYIDVLFKSRKDPKENFIILDTLHTTESTIHGRDPVFQIAYEHALKRLSSLDNVVYVAGAVPQEIPEHGQKITYSYPSILGKQPRDYPRLLVVGGVDASYQVVEDAEDWVKIYAPAVDIKVGARPPNLYTTLSGTPLAAPAVAGVLAMFMSKGKVGAREAVSELLKFSYRRGKTDLHRRVIYNGVWADPTNSAKMNVPGESRAGWDEWEYNSEFCRACTESNGGQPVHHVVWLPGDCPCPDSGNSIGVAER
ncbi:hypothetical protein TWF506_005396 [Arthrobotrys conoides]|uniref:Peptidase S8/S53 domain-containing protein n=1 Tax=Arthrobotrys conoides TaxID=74498 RepID=A0AAN8P6K5_9PEZI